MQEMTTSTKNFLYKLWSVVGGIATLFILTVAIIGTKGCVTEARDRQAACASAGGKILTYSCVTVESVATENWRK